MASDPISEEELRAVFPCDLCGGEPGEQENCQYCDWTGLMPGAETEALAELKAKWQAEATQQLWNHLHTCAICKSSILTPLQNEDVVSCEGCEPHAVFGGDHDDELSDWRDELARLVNRFAKGGE